MENILKQIKRFNNTGLQYGKPFTITLNAVTQEVEPDDSFQGRPIDKPAPQDKMEMGSTYKITVKPYMTEPSSGTFDFQDKWNNGVPMPMVTMVGTAIKETRGMVYMSLQGKAEPTRHCLHCGRSLTNKVSMLYGIGPICGEHYSINPFDTEEELNEHFEELKQKISNIKWEGWVIKSAIKKWEEA